MVILYTTFRFAMSWSTVRDGGSSFSYYVVYVCIAHMSCLYNKFLIRSAIFCILKEYISPVPL